MMTIQIRNCFPIRIVRPVKMKGTSVTEILHHDTLLPIKKFLHHLPKVFDVPVVGGAVTGAVN